MKTMYKAEDILYELDNINVSQGRHCCYLCRYVIGVAFASAWGFLIKREASDFTDLFLFLTLLCSAIYIWYEAVSCAYMSGVARVLHKQVEEGERTEESAAEVMNKESDESFIRLKCKIAFTLFIVMLLSLYVITKFVKI